MTALRNLSALKRNISNRIRQALQELQQNLRNLDRSPTPQRVPVAAGRSRSRLAPHYGHLSRFSGLDTSCFCRFYSSYSGSLLFSRLQISLQSHFYSKQVSPHVSNHVYYNRRFIRPLSTNSRFHFNQWTWRPNLALQSFSHRSQFRSKSFSTFYKTPTLTELLKKKVKTQEDAFGPPPNQSLVYTAIRNSMASSIRLNVSLTEKFHNMVMDLARSQSMVGSYVDFALEPKLFIPSATVLHADIVQEMVANLHRFERHVAELQKDLVRLSELGELPIKYMARERVVRVYFPNCERDHVERLLTEKNVRGGVVYEDTTGQGLDLQREGSTTSISEFDLLSSPSSLSSSCDYDDILSSESDDILSSESDDMMEGGSIVHVEPISTSDHVDIMEESWVY